MFASSLRQQTGIEKSARIHLEIVYFSVRWMLSGAVKVYLVGYTWLQPQKNSDKLPQCPEDLWTLYYAAGNSLPSLVLRQLAAELK